MCRTERQLKVFLRESKQFSLLYGHDGKSLYERIDVNYDGCEDSIVCTLELKISAK